MSVISLEGKPLVRRPVEGRAVDVRERASSGPG
jgi:hypothetical protein